jgi:hypothetical protein
LLWMIVTVAGLGLLLGLLGMRVPVLLIGSVATMVGSLIAAPFVQLPTLSGLLLGIALLCALQWGFLAGHGVSCAWTRSRGSVDRRILTGAEDH